MSDIQALYQSLLKEIQIITIADQSSQAKPYGTFLKRLATDLNGFEMQQVHRAFAKGALLHEMMLADTTTAGQMLNPPCPTAESDYDDIEYLDLFGYVEETASPLAQGYMLVSIGQVLEIIGMDPQFHLLHTTGVDACIKKDLRPTFCSASGPNFSVNHEVLLEHYDAEGEPTAAIKAHFMQVINPKHGIIVAHDNLSPIEATKDAGLDDDGTIPGLKFWSDVAFLQWQSRASEDSELKYVLRYDVLNLKTGFVVEAINVANGADTMPWPGVDYDAGSDQGRALLGTPNGSSVAYMLVQHKRRLGHKTVEKITVFRQHKKLMLLFHVVDVEVQVDTSDARGT